MKKILLFIAILIIIDQYSFCQGFWTQRASIPFTPRWGAVGFSIGSKGYVGTGYDGSTNYGDFWEYDPSSNSWTQISSIPARRAANAFAIGNYGYVCFGVDPSSNYYTDILEYNPSNNTWTQKANFPGTPRYGAAGFAIGNKGYVGCGNEGSASGPYTNEFWEFDPSTNTWTQKTNFPGTPRYGLTHMGWAVGNKGYLGFGLDGPSSWPSDFYEYDPATDAWTQKANFPLPGRSYGVAFSNCLGYLAGTGQNGVAMADIWKYDPSTDTWTQKANFGGGGRWIMTSFVVNGRSFVGTGYDFTNYYNDWWEYVCEAVGVSEQTPPNSLTSIYPTIFKNFATLEIHANVIDKSEISIFDMSDRLVRKEKINSKKSEIHRGNLQNGMYLYEVKNEGKKIGWGKFIVN